MRSNITKFEASGVSPKVIEVLPDVCPSDPDPLGADLGYHQGRHSPFHQTHRDWVQSSHEDVHHYDTNPINDSHYDTNPMDDYPL